MRFDNPGVDESGFWEGDEGLIIKIEVHSKLTRDDFSTSTGESCPRGTDAPVSGLQSAVRTIYCISWYLRAPKLGD